MLKISFIAVSAFLFSSNALANTDWKLDSAFSSVAWKGSKKMGSSHHGSILVKE
ncbi:YceI family protein, partial [bacterium]|nr:YceI family protein [bacterium]